MEKIKTW